MRSSKSRSRSKSNRPRTLGNIVNRVFDSSGPEGKVRGTPQQIIEKYLFLARDAQLSNDRVAAENFLQHAEHYTRMLGEAQREMAAEQDQQRRPDGFQGGPQNGNGNGQPVHQYDQPRDRPRDDRPRDENRADTRPREDRGDNRPREDRADTRPREDRGDTRPREDRGDTRQDNRPDTRNDNRGDNRSETRGQPRNEPREPRQEPREPRQEQREPRPEVTEAEQRPAANVLDMTSPSDNDSGLVDTPETRRSAAPRRREAPALRTPKPVSAPQAAVDPAAVPAEPAAEPKVDGTPRRARAPRKPRSDTPKAEGAAPQGDDPREAAE